jgi:hypothetical protein
VPVRADGVIVQMFIAFVMIGALGIVLRWTFGSQRRSPSSGGTAEPAVSGWAVPKPGPAGTPGPPADTSRPSADASAEPPTVDLSGSGGAAAGTAVTEDFGLLTPVVAVDDAASADRVRARLRSAGIRATTTQGRDGRYRVLVFSSDLHRARRVAGPSG